MWQRSVCAGAIEARRGAFGVCETIGRGMAQGLKDGGLARFARAGTR